MVNSSLNSVVNGNPERQTFGAPGAWRQGTIRAAAHCFCCTQALSTGKFFPLGGISCPPPFAGEAHTGETQHSFLVGIWNILSFFTIVCFIRRNPLTQGGTGAKFYMVLLAAESLRSRIKPLG